MSTRRIGVSYSRFSDLKQAKGDSEDRQEQLFRAFCQHHNLTPLTEVFADRGRSGYKDEHRKKGRLGQLVALAKDGRFEPGTVIVIEAWDRLGRLRPDKQTELVAELLRTGVNIGVCRLDDLFTEDDFGTHKWTTLAVFIQLAYQESKQKADRVAASWASRRGRAREGGKVVTERGTVLTGRIPAWLQIVNGVAVPNAERVAALKRIFRLAADGCGHVRIVRTLTEGNVPPFGTAKWTRPYVSKLLNDRRVLGAYQPCKIDNKPEGAVIEGYYPRVISEDEYLLARAGQNGRRGKGGPRDRRHVNVFQSLLANARDGEGFMLHNHGSAAEPQLMLLNTSAHDGRARKTTTFRYAVFETAVLRRLAEVDPADVLPREKEAPPRADVLRAKLANIRQDLAGLQADLKDGYSKALAAVLRDREIAEEQVAGELQEELARSVRPAERAWRDLPGLVDLVREGGDEARLKLRPVLRRVIDTMLVLLVRRGSYMLAAVQVFFHGGERREYLIVNQPAGNGRPGGSAVYSFADVAAPALLDLRRRTDAKRLEAFLTTVDLEVEGGSV